MNIYIKEQPKTFIERDTSEFSVAFRLLTVITRHLVLFAVSAYKDDETVNYDDNNNFVIITICLSIFCVRLVEIAMEAMDLLLMACHAQTLNLFVESFLRMVQKLMKDANPNLQILATNSVSQLLIDSL